MDERTTPVPGRRGGLYGRFFSARGIRSAAWFSIQSESGEAVEERRSVVG
ncbi:MAG: hypothetical protein U0N62_11220 [Hydrogeniiclostridium sp.]